MTAKCGFLRITWLYRINNKTCGFLHHHDSPRTKTQRPTCMRPHPCGPEKMSPRPGNYKCACEAHTQVSGLMQEPPDHGLIRNAVGTTIKPHSYEPMMTHATAPPNRQIPLSLRPNDLRKMCTIFLFFDQIIINSFHHHYKMLQSE